MSLPVLRGAGDLVSSCYNQGQSPLSWLLTDLEPTYAPTHNYLLSPLPL